MELTAALLKSVPVVMLCGDARYDDVGQSGAATSAPLGFTPKDTMLFNLARLVDVRQAKASVEEDLVRELGKIERGVGFAALNSLAKGAILGAAHTMHQPEICAAVCGHGEPLMRLSAERMNKVCILPGRAVFVGWYTSAERRFTIKHCSHPRSLFAGVSRRCRRRLRRAH